MKCMRATRAVIHLENVKHNIDVVRNHITASDGQRPSICMPVKADAYGHGAVEVARAALDASAESLAVATVDEGAALRNAGIDAPMLLFSEAVPAEFKGIVRYRLTPFISDREYAELFADFVVNGGDLDKDVFLKVDSGMGRLGCAPEEAAELAAFISERRGLRLAGTATHFAVSDSSSAEDKAYTAKQIAVFKGVLEDMKKRGIHPGVVTAANSGATVAYPEAQFDMVRPGILLYGYEDEGIEERLDVRPVMELATKLVHIKKVRKGEQVSYGRTWTAERDTYIGVLPLGYADGLPRLLSGKGFYVVARGDGGGGGKRYPLVGRICMDQCMIDLGPSPEIERYADIAVFGGPGALDAADIAKKIGTISYEICCNINNRVPREYE